MFLEKLSKDGLKEICKIIGYDTDHVFLGLDEGVYVYENHEFGRLNEEKILKAVFASEYIKFMVGKFGKEYMDYLMELNYIPLDLVEEYYGYSNDDWEGK